MMVGGPAFGEAGGDQRHTGWRLPASTPGSVMEVAAGLYEVWLGPFR